VAQRLADEGEIAYLDAALASESYFPRRAAGIALGRRGYRRAAGVLIEVARRGDEASCRVAGRTLEDLTGIRSPAEITGDAWKAALADWEKWWAANR
jgi:hypothetical protein